VKTTSMIQVKAPRQNKLKNADNFGALP